MELTALHQVQLDAVSHMRDIIIPLMTCPTNLNPFWVLAITGPLNNLAIFLTSCLLQYSPLKMLMMLLDEFNLSRYDREKF